MAWIARWAVERSFKSSLREKLVMSETCSYLLLKIVKLIMTNSRLNGMRNKHSRSELSDLPLPNRLAV